VGDLVVLAKGRRYVSNTRYQEYLEQSQAPSISIGILGRDAATIYLIGDETLNGIRTIAGSSN
jgi:hypothetical protein